MSRENSYAPLDADGLIPAARLPSLSSIYQPVDSDLTAIAALTTTSYGRAFLALADAAAGRTALGLGTAALSASTDFQPVDSDLTAIAALTTTSYGRAFLALADAAAGRTALGLGSLATASSLAHSATTGIGATDHHDNANDPSAGQKSALAGTSGTPGVGNEYVTDDDPRNADSRAPNGAAGGDLGGTYPNPTVSDDSHAHTSGTLPGLAPTDADYLVGTAHAGLSAEIVVGATPGGELGGTWAAPTVDATHSGSAHHDPVTVGTGLDVTGQLVELDLSEVAAGGELGGFMDAPTVDATHSGSTHAATQAAAEATADGALTTHAGAADPHAGYRLESADHSHATTGLQGGTIAHSATTGQTATDHHVAPAAGPDADVTIDAAGAAGTASTFARSGHGHKLTTYASAPAAVGTAAAGASGTAPARGDHVHATGAGTPSTQAFGDAAATGSGPAAAMTDHKHAMPADPVTAHEAAGDPHPGYLTPAEGNAAYQPLDADLTSLAAAFPVQGLYAPGSFSVVDGRYAAMVRNLTLTTTQRVTLAGTARLRID